MTRCLIGGLFVAFVLSGCATTWSPAHGRYTSSEQNFEVELPDGWNQYATDKALLATRDGLALEQVTISRYPVGKEMRFTKKTILQGMLPQDAAAVIVDDLRSNQNLKNLTIVENAPESIAGNPGFKIAFAYQTGDELSKKAVVYGVVVDKWYYLISYEAPSRYYFNRYVAAFEGIKSSFKLKK